MITSKEPLMFMDAPIRSSRERYDRKLVSAIISYFILTAYLLAAALLFSSCVSEQTSLDLNTNLTSSDANSGVVYNELNSDSASITEFVSPVPPGSPIPIKAPRQVAASASPTAGATLASGATQIGNTAAQQPVQNGQTPTLVTSLTETNQNPDNTNAQLVNATSQQVVTEVPTTATEQVQPEASQVAALDPGLNQEAPKSNFLKRWKNSATSKKNYDYLRNRRDNDAGLSSNRSKRKKIKQPKMASLVSTDTILSDESGVQTSTDTKSRRSSQEMTSLPGVKTNNQIFGIEEHADEPERKVAALSGAARISPNGLRVQHSKVQVACLKQGVLQILKKVERRYGKKPIITSGYRDPKRNRRAGGARRSQHIYCKAVDIQVEGVSKWNLAKYLRTIPGRGGVGTYCRTKSVHIDIGSKRDWHSKCRRSSVKKRKKKKKT